MSRQNEKVTIYDVINNATEEGAWVNGDFEAIVQNTTQGQGRKPSKCDLCDPDSPNIKITGTWFGGDFTRMNGARVLIGGQGIKAKLYKGNTEVTIGDKATVQIVQANAAPASNTPRTESSANAASSKSADAAAAKPEEVEAHFHRTMKKIALLYLHAVQYVQDIEAKLAPLALTSDQKQAAISSMFITAKDKGLGDRVPAARAIDPATGRPFAYVPPAKDTSEEEAKAKAAAEKAAREAEERERQAAEQAKQDEDVAF